MKSNISGFPEFMPNEQITFNSMIRNIEKQYEICGFIPMDTPAVEKLSTLLSKGNDSEIYGLCRISDPENKSDLGLRFDLTVPFARYVSLYNGTMIMPHKRYQIGSVWRGERPQFGRYRQFYQCDIDIIESSGITLAHDAEIIYTINRTLMALNISDVKIIINNKKILHGFLKSIFNEDDISEVVKIIDKKSKISNEIFEESIKKFQISKEDFNKLSNFLNKTKIINTTETIQWLQKINTNEEFTSGVSELIEVIGFLRSFGIDDKIQISMELARGLNYYTGTIFEIEFIDIPDIGSIASGGRYDNLTSTISNKHFTGVGGSIGISRIFTQLLDKELIDCHKNSITDVLITTQNRDFITGYFKIAEKIRNLSLNSEVYMQNKSLGAQLTYASKKRIPYAIIANETELLEGKAILRNLETKEQQIIKTDHLERNTFNFK